MVLNLLFSSTISFMSIRSHFDNEYGIGSEMKNGLVCVKMKILSSHFLPR